MLEVRHNLVGGSSDPRVGEARRQFQRVLAAWTGDLISLKRWGLDKPGRREVASLILPTCVDGGTEPATRVRAA